MDLGLGTWIPGKHFFEGFQFFGGKEIAEFFRNNDLVFKTVIELAEDDVNRLKK